MMMMEMGLVITFGYNISIQKKACIYWLSFYMVPWCRARVPESGLPLPSELVLRRSGCSGEGGYGQLGEICGAPVG